MPKKPDVRIWHQTQTLPACGYTHITLRPVFLPHDAREDELAEEKHIGPAFIFHCLKTEIQYEKLHNFSIKNTHKSHLSLV